MAPRLLASALRPGARAPLALAAVCSAGAPGAPAAAQLAEPFPAVFDLDRLRAAAGGDGSLGFVLHGYEVDDLAGWSVSSAGDINGDGLDDLIVGAPGQYYTRPYYGPYHLAGRAYILFGRDSAGAGGFAPELDLYALDAAHGFRFEGPALATPQTGYSVASLGDVNGDGIDDIIMGAPKSAHCYVVFGRNAAGGGFPRPVTPEDLHGEGGVTLIGGSGGAAGFAVAGAGDINGDGIADMIVGAPCEAAPLARSGACSIVFGRDHRTPLPGVIDLRALAPPEGLRLGGLGPDHMAGWSVAGAGDVNGDGLADVIIGAPGASFGEIESGSSFVLFGRTDGAFPASLADLDGASGFRIDGDGEYARSGSAVASAGDVNGDGAGDLLVAARGQPRESRVYIVFGRDGSAGGGFDPVLELSAIDGETGLRIDGIPGEETSVAAAGDVNGDGAGDVIIGAPYGAAGAGQSFVIFGRAQAPFPPAIHVSELNGAIGFRIDGGSGGSGQGAAGAGDINGDGADDLVIGAPHAFKLRPGEAFVLFGRLADGCSADCDGDGELTFFDFLCFQNQFAAGDPGADCDGDGSLTFFDFLCFQRGFTAGCP